MKKSYINRLREYEAEKRKLNEKGLTPEEYLEAVKALAGKYGV